MVSEVGAITGTANDERISPLAKSRNSSESFSSWPMEKDRLFMVDPTGFEPVTSAM